MKQLILFITVIVVSTLSSVDARKSYLIKDKIADGNDDQSSSPRVSGAAATSANDYTSKWCNKADDGNDFFCVQNLATVKAKFNFTEKLTPRTDFEEYVIPFKYWTWTANTYLIQETAWEF